MMLSHVYWTSTCPTCIACIACIACILACYEVVGLELIIGFSWSSIVETQRTRTHATLSRSRPQLVIDLQAARRRTLVQANRQLPSFLQGTSCAGNGNRTRGESAIWNPVWLPLLQPLHPHSPKRRDKRRDRSIALRSRHVRVDIMDAGALASGHLRFLDPVLDQLVALHPILSQTLQQAYLLVDCTSR